MHPGLRRALSTAVVLTAGAYAGADATPARLVDRLAALAPARPLRARLSIDAAYRPCRAASAGADELACAGAPPAGRGLVSFSARAAARAEALPTPDALHASALTDLLAAAADTSAASAGLLAGAIESLQSAARLADRPAPVLGDLAAALLLRAERTGNARDLVEAIEVSEQAAELEPGNRAVLFNRALAMERWGLVDQAAEAWHRYSGADAATPWAAEAALHAAALASREPPPAAPRDFSPATVRAFVAGWPQQARELGWNHLLAAWGQAVAVADSAAAETALSRAEHLGIALRDSGRDATLAQAVQAIRVHAGDRTATYRLAEAHRAYAQGIVANADADFAGMLVDFGKAANGADASPVLAGWARMWLAGAEMQKGDTVRSRVTLAAVLAGSDTSTTPALAGRARLIQATLRLRTGSLEEALDDALAAATLLGRLGETELAGGALYVAADAELNLGASVRAYAMANKALRMLRPYRGSVFLANSLSLAARTAWADAMPHSAALFQHERVAVVRRVGRPAMLAEAYLGLAQARVVLGQVAAADSDALAAERVLARVSDRRAHQWLDADVLLVHGRRYAASRPARAAAAFDSVMDAPGLGTATSRVLQALLGRAQLRLGLGRTAEAEADLDSATRIVGRQGAAAFRGGNRAALLQSAKAAFDRIVLLRLARGDTAGALRSLERGRVSFAPTGGHRADTGGEWRIPAGSVALDYALIGDTLLIWTLRSGNARLTRVVQNRAELVRVTERTRTALERQDDEAALRHQLAWLRERLVRPVEAQLGRSGTPLVLVTDGEVPADVFAALYDVQRGRYLVQDHSVRFVPALRDAEPGRAAGPVQRAVIAGDPAFDPTAYPGLKRLPQARIEADSIAALYPGTSVLTGSAVTASALTSAFSRADVIHFAGHAVFDDEQADRSYLVLAPTPGSHSPGALTAAQLDTFRLGGVRLVVLSACETLRSRSGRSGGFSGFAAALLGAGAGGVVGSSWKVEDRASRAAMIEFHRAWRGSGDAASALQRAQLAMLRSHDPALRSPAAWAAFRYAGH